MSDKRILIVEDDPSTQRVLKDNFEFTGYKVQTAAEGRTGWQEVQTFRPDLIVLDVMLPQINGFDLCRRIRQSGLTMPIIMLTAKSQESDVVLGLNLGADDYVTKPFSVDVLLARTAAHLRRHGINADAVISFGACELSTASHRLFLKGCEITLTPKEFKLLEFLVRNAGCALTRERILDAVWGRDLIVTQRSVDRCITTLRSKIEAGSPTPLISTIRDVGYRFEAEPKEKASVEGAARL